MDEPKKTPPFYQTEDEVVETEDDDVENDFNDFEDAEYDSDDKFTWNEGDIEIVSTPNKPEQPKP